MALTTKQARKPKAKKSAAKSPAKIRQAHGGALFTGGNPGNKGGTGRPPSAIREQLRGSFAERIAVLERFADGAMPLTGKCAKCGHEELATIANVLPVEASDRLRAIDMLAKYGLGTLKEVSVENVRERVQGTLAVIRKHASPEQAAAIISEMRPLWA